MSVDFLLEIFDRHRDRDAIVWRDEICSYGGLLEWVERLRDEIDVAEHSAVSLEADFSPTSVAAMLVLIERRCTIVPLTSSVEAKKPDFRRIAQVETIVEITADDEVIVRASGIEIAAPHPIALELRKRGHPGLVLFSSGSTGESKAALHDFAPLLEKFKVPRHSKRAITFLLFDHIGGVNTLFYTLSNAGCIVTVGDRSPDTVCRTIARFGVQTLPTSPTFLNLLLLSEAADRHDLSSLELITYGTEVMAETTLARIHKIFPDVRLLQTYGLSEVGILRSKSRSSDSLWVKVGGEDFETRVVDGMLEIKARSAMLGYLNAPNPFTEDGWFKTGDAVEVDGEYIRILGRKSEIINVGGEKVYPVEIEDVLQMMEGVEDVAVTAAPNPITGQMVKARVKLTGEESLRDFKKRMHAFCRGRLDRFKIPSKVILCDEALHGGRFKKMRGE